MCNFDLIEQNIYSDTRDYEQRRTLQRGREFHSVTCSAPANSRRQVNNLVLLSFSLRPSESILRTHISPTIIIPDLEVKIWATSSL